MTGQEMLEALENLDPAYIEAAAVQKVRKTSRIKKWGTIAACLVLLLSAGFGTYAYAAEVKEYNAAVRFFGEYDLPTEGLTRGDIKAVYRDISTQTFHYSKTEEVIENSLTPEQKTEYKELKGDQNAGNAADLWEYKIQNTGSQPTIETTQPTKPTETTQPTQPTQSGVVTQSGMTFRILPEHPGGYAVTACEKTVSGELVIPETVNGLPVVAIGYEAFMSCVNLTSVVIPDSVTSIGMGAFFGCHELTGITLGSKIAFIGEYAFASCGKLKYNQYDNALYLGSATNPYMLLIKAVTEQITQCQIHPETKRICSGAFTGCIELKRIIIPEGVETVERQAFSGCTGLAEVSVPVSVTAFGSVTSLPNAGDGVFYNCPGLVYNIYDNAKYLGNDTNPYMVLVKATSEHIRQCRIHPETKFVHADAFSGCTQLKEIVIPDNVISVGNSFEACNSLTDIYLGKGVKTISVTIWRLPNLKGFWVSEENPYLFSDQCGVLFDQGKTRLLIAPAKLSGHYTVPDSVQSIRGIAFEYCTGLTQITFGKNVANHNLSVLNRPTDLIITVAEGNPNYKTDSAGVLFSADGKRLIKAFSSLKGHYTIPADVVAIERAAFELCIGLESITLPETVQDIGYALFCPSYKQRTVYYTGTEAGWKERMAGRGDFLFWTIICRDTAETVPTTKPTRPSVPETRPTQTQSLPTAAQSHPTTMPTTPTEGQQKDGGSTNNGSAMGAAVAALVILSVGMIMYYMKKKKT